LVRRMHLPRQKANDGKTLVAVDMCDFRHKPAVVVRRVDLDALLARVDELEDCSGEPKRLRLGSGPITNASVSVPNGW
jgi:hypothetical protein